MITLLRGRPSYVELQLLCRDAFAIALCNLPANIHYFPESYTLPPNPSKPFTTSRHPHILFFGAVCVVPPTFSHPGGRDVFKTYV